MILIPIGYKQMAEILFKSGTTSRKIEFYIDKNSITNEGEGAGVLKVVSIADDATVIGNYYGGGMPFCYDMTRDENSEGLAKAFKEYFDYIGAGDEVYAETNTGHIEELPLPTGFGERERVVIVLEDCSVENVYSTNGELLVEIIDKNELDTENHSDIEVEIDDLNKQIESHALRSIW